MIFAGHWKTLEDGVTRPIIRVEVRAADKSFIAADFLIDTGADHTVFSSALYDRLGVDAFSSQVTSLVGIGGAVSARLTTTAIAFTDTHGRVLRIHAQYAAIIAADEGELSILGRDVLDQFDLVFSRQHDQILLLRGQHRATVQSD